MLFGSRVESPKVYSGQRTVDAVVSYVFDEMKSLVDRRLHPRSSNAKKEPPKEEKKKQETKKEETKKEEPKKPEPKNEQSGQEDKDVIVLTESTFDTKISKSKEIWMVEFYGIDIIS